MATVHIMWMLKKFLNMGPVFLQKKKKKKKKKRKSLNMGPILTERKFAGFKPPKIAKIGENGSI